MYGSVVVFAGFSAWLGEAASRIFSHDVVVDTAAAYARSHALRVAGRRTLSPASGMSRSTMRSRYPLSWVVSAVPDRCWSPGKPEPRTKSV